MKESNNSRRIVGKFAARFIILGVIFGAIALVLETWVPEYANWGLDSRRVIFSSVVSIIATLCTAYFAVSSSISGVIFKSQEEAEKVSKPIKTFLILVALIAMFLGLIYCIQIEKSALKTFDNKLENDKETQQLYDTDKLVEAKKTEIQLVSNVMVAAKEIMIVLTYGYAVVYSENMVMANVRTKAKKEEDEE